MTEGRKLTFVRHGRHSTSFLLPHKKSLSWRNSGHFVSFAKRSSCQPESDEQVYEERSENQQKLPSNFTFNNKSVAGQETMYTPDACAKRETTVDTTGQKQTTFTTIRDNKPVLILNQRPND